ncbi:MAG TPA: D-glycero-beta-D-manno-heptose-7-phosphate kinase [Pyrinomonadaceae bacterium]|jgi:D-beta-D-heptose 7-phosphate kinase/D-beta-D-heptose 1-phosphate adenosyltransferase|nr:D-glycero-beta-D-manno-heptose-7-phosphate kinase [Pyrinomonadaceae bacterium]
MSKIEQQRADELLRRASERFIVVYGDVMLDEFVWGDVTRISPEAPVPVVEVRRESVHLGGAANVLANVVALGARASVTGVVGNDRAGEMLRAELKETGMSATDDTLILDESRPTTLKTRIIAHNQPVVRTDREQRTPVDAQTEARIIEVLTKAIKETDAFVVSDYDKGAVTQRILSEILPIAYKRGIPVLIDPKIRNFDAYRPATLVTPNHLEALRLANMEDYSDEALKRAAHLIRERVGCESVLITRGERGMMLLESYHEPVYVETVAREVYDVTGAGDTVIATLAATLAAGASMLEAAILANHAAGIVVGKIGTATASAEELINSIQREA